MTDTLDDLVSEVESEALIGTQGPALQTKKFALQALLDKAASVVPTKDLMPVLKNFLIEATPGRIRVVATDLVLSVAAVSEMVTVTREGTCVLPAKRLLEIVKEAGDGDLLLDVADGTATITVGRTVWRIKIMSGDDYPDLPTVEDVTFYALDRSKFSNAITSVRYAAATETHRASLMMLDLSSGRLRASDGVRFQQCKLPVPEGFPDIQIPINAVDDLVKILRGTEATEIEVGEDDDSLIFKIGGDVFIAQKLNATFPDMDEALIKPALANQDSLIVDRQDLISAIKRVRITADPETSAVILRLSTDKILVTAKDKYGSEASEEVDAKWSLKDRQVAFNHAHLLDMLSMAEMKACEFKLGVDTKTRPAPILLEDPETGSLGILNQIRVDFLT